MSRSRRRLAGALAALALALPGVSLADDLDSARAAFVEAMALAKQGRWPEATERYAASLRLHRSAGTLYSLGVAQKESGRLVEARESLAAFLAEPSGARTRDYELPARAALAEIDRRVAHVTLALEPGPIEHPSLSVDGEAPREVPLEGGLTRNLVVNPGPHEIVARAPGRTEARARLTLPEGGAGALTLTLVPLPASPPDSAPRPLPPTTVPEAPGPASPPPGQVEPPGGPRRPVSFALMGTGVAVFVTGVAVGLAGLAQAHAATSPTGPAADAAKAKGLAGDTLAGCGIVAAGVGLVLLLTAPRPNRSSARPWIEGHGAGATLHF